MIKVFANTIIQRQTNILLTPDVAILQNGRPCVRVNISASNPPKSEVFLSKYTFPGVGLLILITVF